jgi:glycerol-3-phosphate dehydrogenase
MISVPRECSLSVRAFLLIFLFSRILNGRLKNIFLLFGVVVEDYLSPKKCLVKTQVLIIGGGATGTGLARDLALRGVQSLLVEKKDINAGASGGNHGLLHSGARYVSSDPEAAKECREEGQLLKNIAAQCVEDTGGLFVAVQGDDENYIADFPEMCDRCGIPAQAMDLQEVRLLEPALSELIIAAYKVPDAAIDPFRLSLDNMAQAQQHGSRLLSHTMVRAFEISGSEIKSVQLQNTQTGEKALVEAHVVINAAGAWAGLVAGLAGISIPVLFSKGSLLITHNRLANRVLNRLRPASNADILVPGGTVSILGTTSIRIENPDEAYPTVEEIDLMVEDAGAMIPALETTRYIRAYCGVRPLISLGGDSDDRKVSRGFTLMDHGAQGVENFFTISGGKLTTYRMMAEKTADLVCQYLGISKPCRTRTEPLPPSLPGRWTEPTSAPKTWLKEHDPDDIILCECEMVPRSAVDSIVDSIHKQGEKADLQGIGLRTRIGKGPCQGAFCGPRLTTHLFDQKEFGAVRSLDGLRDFVRSRWKGLHPILWGQQLQQAELLEAMDCGLFGLELED